MMYQYLFWISLFLVIKSSSALNPGLKLRISQKGLQYAANQAVLVLSKDVNGQTIPDVCDEAHVSVVGHISYCISGMRISGFSSPTTSVTTSPFHWRVANVGARIDGDWKYHNHGFIHISDHGGFDIKLAGWSLDVTLVMGVDGNGRPTIQLSNCNCGAGDVDVHFHSGASWLYNLFKDHVADAIKKTLTSKLCDLVTQSLSGKAAAQLATLKVDVVIDKVLTLDYRLISAPVFSSTFMETAHKGEVYWTGDMVEAPITPPPVSELGTDRMVTIWLSEYVINTMGYVMYKHNELNYNLTNKDLPPSNAGALNTTCTANGLFSICIGNFIPILAQKFPQASVMLGLNVTQLPKLNIAPSGITGNMSGVISYYIVYPNKPALFAFSTSSSVSFNLTAAIKGSNVTGTINDFQIGKVDLVKSNIGKIDVTSLNFVLKIAVNAMKPKLQDLASRGIALPTINDVAYASPQITLVQNAIGVQTDVKYVGDKLHLKKLMYQN